MADGGFCHVVRDPHYVTLPVTYRMLLGVSRLLLSSLQIVVEYYIIFYRIIYIFVEIARLREE
jgi:hypothetical protein